MFVVGLALGLTAGAPLVHAQAPLLPARGEASAPVVLLLFSDFQCPYCARVEPILKSVREQFPTDVQVVFKHNPLPIHPQAPLAHEAAAEAARQGRFWEMHDRLFAQQQTLQRDALVTHARELGLDVDAFTRALDTHTHRPAIARDMAEARALGVTGTPTLFVNGQRLTGAPAPAALTALIRRMLNGGGANESDSLPTSTFDLSGSPARGPADAPVTIVEFSDLQCGYCARASSVVARVVSQYPDRVRWVFKHYPLEFHADAPLAHRAALAARQQGRFWEMHDAVFANQRAMKRTDLLAHASRLGLDMPRFTADLDSDRFSKAIDRDMAEGNTAGVNGTPTFFVNGRRLVGAQPYEVIAAAVEQALGARPRQGSVGEASGAKETASALEAAMSRGPADAPVTIQWFADLTSPLHREALVLLRRSVDAHPQDVRVVFRHAPATDRGHARLLHEAAAAAAEQGRFWQLHDVLMARPTTGGDRATLADYAARLGLDRARFVDALTSGRSAAVVERHLADARAHDVRGTPTFFVNDRRIDGVVTAADLDAIVAAALEQVRLRHASR
jgi:protein-disulfide isomerase